MTSPFAVPRLVIVCGIVVPLAALLGFLLAAPESGGNLLLLAVIMGLMCLPLLLRWHHALLIFTWNATLIAAMLPGRPSVWMLMAVASLGFACVNFAMDKEQHMFIGVRSVTWPLLVLVALVVVTAKLTGGFAVRAMGSSSSYGGKGYFYILFAVAGYFALTGQRIPREKAMLYVSIFFLAGLTSVFSNIAYSLGPSFFWLFYLFPVDVVMHQLVADHLVGQTNLVRVSGIAFAGISAFGFMLCRYGISGILDFSKPWRIIAFVGIVFASAFGGFRSVLILFAIALVIQFFLEGLHRTRLLMVGGLSALMIGVILVPLAGRLPMPVQRSLSFLPLDLDPLARLDAKTSLDWRLDMWRILAPQIPQYFFFGKGYAVDATDMYMSIHSERRGYAQAYESSIVAGDYHNGGLSVIIPFGIWGVLTFVWFLVAGGKVLRRNMLYGDPELKSINTFLFCIFVTRIVFFFIFFGAFSSDLFHFTGLVGLSLSLNGGVCQPQKTEAPKPEATDALAEVNPRYLPLPYRT